MKNMRVVVEASCRSAARRRTSRSRVIGRIGTAGGTGSAIEFAGSTIARCRWKAG
jgi:3-isopropylmalate/(R)-2-methylmalate dehydratase large subunit